MKKLRIHEIDLFRAVAIILMVIYHILVDLDMYFNINIDYNNYPLKFVGRLSAIMFIGISGISSNFSKNNIKNGLKVFSFGLILTAFTLIFFNDGAIIFGILHLIGFGIITAPLLNKTNKWLLLASGTISIYAGIVLKGVQISSSLLIPFGITSQGFYSVDYYPILPWYGVFIIGHSLGRIFYKEKKGLLLPSNFRIILLEKIGKKSLIIYLIHQPIIMSILYIIFQLNNS